MVEGGRSDTQKHTSLLELHSGNYKYQGQQEMKQEKYECSD